MIAPSHTLTRLPDQTKQTLGHLDIDGRVFPTVELPWKNNEHKISCIPTGTYLVTKRYNEKHGHHFLINDVPSRDYCLIHSANYSRELEGCIAPGQGDHIDIDHDGLKDVASSKAAMQTLNTLLPDEWYLTIV